MSSSTALVKRQNEDMALMPPPPTKRTKRPSTVLDEDDYTDALSEIIARDYFPGLAEVKAQEEYLNALDSNNDMWIREAGAKLKQSITPLSNRDGSTTPRDIQSATARSWDARTHVPDTPRGGTVTGGETPVNGLVSDATEEANPKARIDTARLSLGSFQAKYTSEDNESFNSLLDKQNNTRRKKHAYLWTSDQRIPSQRLLTHRASETKLIEAKASHEAEAHKYNEQPIQPITTGATSSRPASVQTWHQRTPNSSLMFPPDSIDDTGLQTIFEAKEAASKAGPKQTVFANTRFQPQFLLENDDHNNFSIPPSPSLNTQIISARDSRRAAKPYSEAPTESSFDNGSETPRVNGYTFVDDDEPDSIRAAPVTEPSYRDLLAGQVGDSVPNPFKISETRRREDLHLRLVARDQARKREKENHMRKHGVGQGVGNMTPAARSLMERIGRTPVVSRREGTDGPSSSGSREMWTPGATPRRKR